MGRGKKDLQGGNFFFLCFAQIGKMTQIESKNFIFII